MPTKRGRGKKAGAGAQGEMGKQPTGKDVGKAAVHAEHQPVLKPSEV
jgi:hypothetical protein